MVLCFHVFCGISQTPKCVFQSDQSQAGNERWRSKKNFSCLWMVRSRFVSTKRVHLWFAALKWSATSSNCGPLFFYALNYHTRLWWPEYIPLVASGMHWASGRFRFAELFDTVIELVHLCLHKVCVCKYLKYRLDFDIKYNHYFIKWASSRI